MGGALRDRSSSSTVCHGVLRRRNTGKVPPQALALDRQPVSQTHTLTPTLNPNPKHNHNLNLNPKLNPNPNPKINPNPNLNLNLNLNPIREMRLTDV